MFLWMWYDDVVIRLRFDYAFVTISLCFRYDSVMLWSCLCYAYVLLLLCLSYASVILLLCCCCCFIVLLLCFYWNDILTQSLFLKTIYSYFLKYEYVSKELFIEAMVRSKKKTEDWRSPPWCVSQYMVEVSTRGWVCLGQYWDQKDHATKGEVTVRSPGQVIGPGDQGTPKGCQRWCYNRRYPKRWAELKSDEKPSFN